MKQNLSQMVCPGVGKLFSMKSQVRNYFWLCRSHTVCHNWPSVVPKSWAWLCSGKTVLTKVGSEEGIWLVGQSSLIPGLNEKTLRDGVQLYGQGASKGHGSAQRQQQQEAATPLRAEGADGEVV